MIANRRQRPGVTLMVVLLATFILSIGIIAIIVCAIMTFVGFIWLRKILQIEV